jgi:mono/diheme cytochrome c family protein
MFKLNKPRNWMVVIAAVSLACATGPVAWAAGSAQRGKAIARQECSNCHVVSKSDAKALEGLTDGPDFAAMKDMTAADLKARLNSPHPVMSKFPALTGPQIDDLVAFIASANK